MGRAGRAIRIAAAGGLLAGALASPTAADTIYKWVDGDGVVHLTDRPRHSGYERISRTRRNRKVRQHPSNAFDPIISLAASRHQVPAALIKAVVAAESAFNPRAVSSKGAMGLMQLMPGTADSLGVSEPFVARANIDGGTRYLRGLHDRYGDWFKTLAAYNAGPEAVARYDGIPPYKETRQYLKRVLTYYRRYDGDFSR